jgi:hypothetical protein
MLWFKKYFRQTIGQKIIAKLLLFRRGKITVSLGFNRNDNIDIFWSKIGKNRRIMTMNPNWAKFPNFGKNYTRVWNFLLESNTCEQITYGLIDTKNIALLFVRRHLQTKIRIGRCRTTSYDTKITYVPCK